MKHLKTLYWKVYKMYVYIIRLYLNSNPQESWINSQNLAFKTEKLAKNYCDKLKEKDYFWAYTIQPLLLINKESD